MLSRTLGNLLETGLKLHPDRLAVTDGKLTTSFAELENAAMHVANWLENQSGSHTPKTTSKREAEERAEGFAPRIMVVASKRTAIVAAAIGIWKAGFIYVPVDEDTPGGRFSHLLASIEPTAVIAEKGWFDDKASLVKAYAKLSLETIDEFFKHPAPLSLPSLAPGEPERKNKEKPEDLAYILHTSGSTGRPKGVMMSHEAVLTYFAGHNEVLDFRPGDMCLNNAPFHFDVSIQDTFLPLFFGAGVVLTPGMKIGALLLRQMEQHKITHLIAVATILTLIASDEARLKNADLHALRVVMTGAEVCHVDMINRWFDVHPSMRVINGYGPTEVNSISVVHLIEKPDSHRTSPYPVGKPLRTVFTRLENDEGEEIRKAEQQGELLLSGPQMMQGYWRNEEATRAVIVRREERDWYKTGDLCHFNNRWELVFDGRTDAEVKISGRRIHLAEIRSLMQSHLARTRLEASTFIRAPKQGQGRIIIALVASGTKADFIPPTPQITRALEEELKQELPAYMVPERIAFCPRDAVLNSNGKLDLPALEEQLLDLALSGNEQRFFSWHQNHLVSVFSDQADIHEITTREESA